MPDRPGVKVIALRHAKHGWTWIWSFNLRPTWCSKVHGSLLHKFQVFISKGHFVKLPWLPPPPVRRVCCWSKLQILRISEKGEISPRHSDSVTQVTRGLRGHHLSPAVAAVRLSSLTPYHLVMTNSLPWEDPPFLRTVNHLFLWAIYTMAMLVITRGYLQMPHSGLIGPDLGDSTEAPRKYCSWKPQDLIHWGLTTTILQL